MAADHYTGLFALKAVTSGRRVNFYFHSSTVFLVTPSEVIDFLLQLLPYAPSIGTTMLW